MLTRDQYLVGWAVGHGLVPSRPVALWLRFAYRVALPLARARVPASLVSLLGVVLIACGATVSGWWAAAGSALVALGGLCDGVDGAVALVSRRASRRGALVDAACDRVGDALLGVGLAAAGAAWWVCAAAVAVGFAHEGLRVLDRRRDGSAGLTVSERPTRVIVTAMFLLAAGLGPFADGAWWAGAGAWVLLTVGVVGLAQLVAAGVSA